MAAAIGGGVLLVIAALLAFVKPSPQNAGTSGMGTPRLVVDQELVDFGDVKVDRVVEATFRLTNQGDGTLRFTKDPYIEVLEGC